MMSATNSQHQSDDNVQKLLDLDVVPDNTSVKVLLNEIIITLDEITSEILEAVDEAGFSHKRTEPVGPMRLKMIVAPRNT